MNKDKPIYQSKEWQKVRRSHLHRHPWCVVCAQLGIKTYAQEVDHIEPERFGGGRFAPINLQSLCISHHSQKTARGPEHGSSQTDRPFIVTGPDGYSAPAGIVSAHHQGEDDVY